MLKQITLIIVVLCVLTGCEKKQQNTGMVFNREKPSDFTVAPPPKTLPPEPPMLPGKAQVIGAPFYDFQTQTGKSSVQPTNSKIKSVPSDL